jgi:secondary thiamine-phosphate synthase enzyme
MPRNVSGGSRKHARAPFFRAHAGTADSEHVPRVDLDYASRACPDRPRPRTRVSHPPPELRSSGFTPAAIGGGGGATPVRQFMQRFTIDISTDGNSDVVNLSPELNSRLREVRGQAMAFLFVVGSTAALTTLEYEPGLVKHDLPRLLQRLVPDDGRYEHEATWNDDNGHSHLRAALIGPSLAVPIADGRLMTCEYQQVVLVDFDTRPRRRTVIVTVV